MNSQLQIILIISTILFFIFIIKMILDYKLNLKYSLTWISSSIVLILLSLFPSILSTISKILHIKEMVNALYLVTLFFLLVITFSLSLALSKKSEAIKDLVQEVGFLKLQIEELKSAFHRKEHP